MSQYHIYQLPVEAGYAFRGWNETKDRFSINDYNKVYSCELWDQVIIGGKAQMSNTNALEVLEDLFAFFNWIPPSDYTGRSISVSDVIEIVREEESKYYYCDSLGWKEIEPGL